MSDDYTGLSKYMSTATSSEPLTPEKLDEILKELQPKPREYRNGVLVLNENEILELKHYGRVTIQDGDKIIYLMSQSRKDWLLAQLAALEDKDA